KCCTGLGSRTAAVAARLTSARPRLAGAAPVKPTARIRSHGGLTCWANHACCVASTLTVRPLVLSLPIDSPPFRVDGRCPPSPPVSLPPQTDNECGIPVRGHTRSHLVSREEVCAPTCSQSSRRAARWRRPRSPLLGENV